MKNPIKLKLIFFLAMPILFVLPVNKIYAAKFSVETSSGSNGVSVYLDTEGKEINAVDLIFGFDSGDLLVTGVSDGNSIINFWVEPPGFSNDTGEIRLVGIVPGGFSGTHGLLAKIFFQPEKTGSVQLTLKQAKVLLNDGTGSETKISQSQLNFAISNQILQLETDTASPETFTPEIASSSDIFGGQWFLSFSTADKGSGIDHYEVMELPAGSAFNISGGWNAATSPYLLKDQSLRSDVYVRAIDRKGNFTTEKFAAKREKGIPAIIYIILVIALLLLIVGSYRRARRGKNRKT